MALPKTHKTWLVAVDGSEISTAGIELSLDTMKENDELILLHVSKHSEEHDAAGKKVLEDAVAFAKSLNPKVKLSTYFQKADHFGSEIVNQARFLAADFIVTGQRGIGGVKAALLGSVSDYVAKNASCPVVITHAPYV